MYGIQHNRNPYIDHPEYAAMIWGNPVGTDQPERNDYLLPVYPNPADEQCAIELPVNMAYDDLSILCFSVSGLKYDLQISLDGNSLKADVQNLPKGIYFLVVAFENSVYRAKLVKD
jgi:hypothetical protein